MGELPRMARLRKRAGMFTPAGCAPESRFCALSAQRGTKIETALNRA
jgi:hypothetical protein